MKLKEIFKAWLKTIVMIAILVGICWIAISDTVTFAVSIAIYALYRSYYNDKD